MTVRTIKRQMQEVGAIRAQLLDSFDALMNGSINPKEAGQVSRDAARKLKRIKAEQIKAKTDRD